MTKREIIEVLTARKIDVACGSYRDTIAYAMCNGDLAQPERDQLTETELQAVAEGREMCLDWEDFGL